MTEPSIRPIAGPAAWRGPDIAGAPDLLRRLAPGAIAEIDDAHNSVTRRGLDWPEIGRADFPLPSFAAELADIARELEEGRGFVMLRGLPA